MPVPGYESAYEVSDQGRVRSLNYRRTGRVRLLSPAPDGRRGGRGYLGVNLGFVGRRYVRVHVLVLLAFVGPRPPGMEACHRNGDRTDNRLENLRWGTHAENAADTQRHGHVPHGERHCMARLSDTQVAEIRAAGGLQREVAERFGISRSYVSELRRKRARG
jgi:hypothetical protein